MMDAVLTPTRRQRGLFMVGLAGAGVGFALAIQMGLNANFLADVIGVSGLQLGLLEAVRESCGIFALGILALLAGRSEPAVGAAMLVLVGVGLAGYGIAHDYLAVMLMSLVWSQGLHVWMPLPSSMALGLAEPGRTGFRLGQVRGAGSAGFGVGLIAAWLLTRFGVAMRPQFFIAGAVCVGAAAVCVGIPREIRTPGPRLVFRRQYGLYYLLSFLEGWRKQIFICFAGFLLVRRHGTPLATMLLLLGLVQLIRYVAAPHVGRLIDRIGERPVLTVYFSGLTLFFIGYATISSRPVLYVLFVADNAFFALAMALTTYVNRLVPPGERTPTLSMGVAMNHVAAVAMPLAGGLLWKFAGYQWVFAAGALAALASVFAARRIPQREALPARAE